MGAHYDLSKGAAQVPVQHFESLAALNLDPTQGASRYRVLLDGKRSLDALLVNKASSTLVVVFHGAMVTGHHHLPRFEWLRTLNERTSYSCLFLSDPTLTLDPKLLLGWYLGWEGMDLYPVLAGVAMRAAEVCGAERIIFAGSSGGGFAALQVSALVPGSMAVPFNAQTAVNRYHWEAQLSYIRRIAPHLQRKKKSRRHLWARPWGDRAYAINRYKVPLPNYVLYAQNVRDKHHYHEHYLPFVTAVERSPNTDRVIFEEYSAAPFHEPPGRGRFVESIRRGAEILSAENPLGEILTVKSKLEQAKKASDQVAY